MHTYSDSISTTMIDHRNGAIYPTEYPQDELYTHEEQEELYTHKKRNYTDKKNKIKMNYVNYTHKKIKCTHKKISTR